MRSGLKSSFKQSLIAAALMALAASVQADLALAEKSTCLNCHALEKKSVGPSFTAIAAKYRSQPEAALLLRSKVEKGGQGVWGAVPMPAMAYLPKDDVQAIVNWIVKLP
jgi:cytochrome c